MGKRWAVYGLVIALVAVAVGIVAAMRRVPEAAQPTRAVASAAQPAPTPARTETDNNAAPVRGAVMDTALFRNMATRENPVVVYITTKSRMEAPELTEFNAGDDFLRRFFGGPTPRGGRVQRGLGSGFVISPEGEILTNNHVVAGAEQIRVGLYGSDRTTYVATVVGRDPLTDSALIKIQTHRAPSPSPGWATPTPWSRVIGSWPSAIRFNWDTPSPSVS